MVVNFCGVHGFSYSHINAKFGVQVNVYSTKI